jgi:hypothetical protein
MNSPVRRGIGQYNHDQDNSHIGALRDNLESIRQETLGGHLRHFGPKAGPRVVKRLEPNGQHIEKGQVRERKGRPRAPHVPALKSVMRK